MKKVFAIVLGVLAFTASAKEGYTPVPDAEKPSLGAVLGYGIKSALKDGVSDTECELQSAKFHVDRLNEFERQWTGGNVLYHINALVSDNSEKVQNAVVDVTVAQNGKTGAFSYEVNSIDVL